MGLSYQENYIIPFELSDIKHDVNLPQLISYCISISGKHSTMLGRSDQYLFDHYHLVWIVTDYEIEINRLPKFKEEVTIKTEAMTYNRFFCYRQFEIRDLDGELLISILSYFALLNPESRKLAQIPDDLVAPYQSEFVKKIKRAPKLHALNGDIMTKDYHVRYYDIDHNGHVNNSKYLDWMFDVLNFDFLCHHIPKSITLKYVKEVAPGGDVTSRCVFEDNVSHHDIISNGQVNAQALIKWQEVEKSEE